MITKRQAQSYYMRAFFKADAQWSKNRRTAYENILDSIADDTQITVIDCHI